MTRIEFDGQGARIPTIALPPFGSDSDLPPVVFTFTDNAEFPIGQYRDLGFTHFEVSCVGAAGGRGGDATNAILWVQEVTWQPVPQDVWNLRLEQIRISDYLTSGVWDKIYGWGVPGPNGNGVATMAEFRNWENPNRMMDFTTYKFPVLFPYLTAAGGAGGGGGFHKLAGVLADLPDVVPIVVGKVGADSPYGQVVQNGSYVPNPLPVPSPPDPRGYPWDRQVDIANYLLAYRNSYPDPHPALDMPVKGVDGGYSAFGDVGKASGGEGGDPGMVWEGSAFALKGNGGDGGIGGRIVVGGGGAGSIAEGVNGSDGIWHPETGIGAGGGGGKAGREPTFTPTGPTPGGPGAPIVTKHLATAGGQGSYSFGDTSVYGQRQFRQPWTYLKPVPGYTTFSFPNYPGNVVSLNGTVTYTQVVDSTNLVIPGGGGGARPMTSLKAGSRAPGYSPDGVVVVRLTKIT